MFENMKNYENMKIYKYANEEGYKYKYWLHIA